jgi:hypothetical protein
MATVLITGASAGLGEGFARAFAARGDETILVARRADRLDRLAATLPTRAHVIAHDLGSPGAGTALLAEVERRGLTIDTLVNNAGFGLRGAFGELDRERQLDIVDLNCRVLVELCHAVLPGMTARRRGGILNIASTAAFQPGPWMAVYYASKAFVLSFSEALHEEVRAQGVHVSALCPGPTRTEFADVAGMADSPLFQRFGSDAGGVVRDGIAALDRNEAVKVSGAMNAAMAGSIRLAPRTLTRRIVGALQKRR